VADDIADCFIIVAAVGAMGHFPNGDMLDVVHADVRDIFNRQPGLSALLCQIEFLAEEEDGVVYAAASGKILLGENDGRAMPGIDTASRMGHQLLSAV